MSIASAIVITPLVVGGTAVGTLQFGTIGGLIVGALAFLVGVFIEMHLIAWRTGVSRNIMLVCRGLNLRGRVETFGNDILRSYDLLRRRDESDPWFLLNLSRLADDLFKGLNALSHFPDLDGYGPWEEKFEVLVRHTEGLAKGRGDSCAEDIQKAIVDLRLRARSFSALLIKHIVRG